MAGLPVGTDALSDWMRRLYSTMDGPAQERIKKAAGFAGKDAALEAVTETLGQDRAMSNFKGGRVKLSAGFDTRPGSTEVVIRHGPPGLWVLADKGRQRSGPIYPRASGGRYKGRKAVAGRAVMTPQGPRAASSFGPSRGSGTLRRAAAKERTEIPRAAFKALRLEIGRVVGNVRV